MNRFIALFLTLLNTAALGDKVPSSPRSKQVIAALRPKLVKQLEPMALQIGSPLYIRLFKEPGILEIWLKKGPRFHLFKTYPICNFSGGIGPKLKEGDKQAPEGFYAITAKAMNPNSSYHLSFNLGFPNSYDRFHKRTGNHLMVHGECVSIGCFAMGNEAIEEIWTLAQQALDSGQQEIQVSIFPFPLTSANLELHAKSPMAWLLVRPENHQRPI